MADSDILEVEMIPIPEEMLDCIEMAAYLNRLIIEALILPASFWTEVPHRTSDSETTAN